MKNVVSLLIVLLMVIMSCSEESLLNTTDQLNVNDSSWDIYSSIDVNLENRKAILTFDGENCVFDYGENDYDRGTYEIVDGVFIFNSLYIIKWNIHWISNNEFTLTRVKEATTYYLNFVCIRR